MQLRVESYVPNQDIPDIIDRISLEKWLHISEFSSNEDDSDNVSDLGDEYI